jgi:hypothetical protein
MGFVVRAVEFREVPLLRDSAYGGIQKAERSFGHSMVMTEDIWDHGID